MGNIEIANTPIPLNPYKHPYLLSTIELVTSLLDCNVVDNCCATVLVKEDMTLTVGVQGKFEV